MDERDLYGTTAKRGIGGALLAALIAFLLGAALTAYAVHRWDRVVAWLHPVPAPLPVVITRRVPVPVPTPVPSDGALAARVDTIASRIEAIDTRAAQASGDADRAERLLLAFAARRALDRGQPLGYLEGMLRDRFGADDAPSVALIIASAQKPVTLPQLQDGLAALAPDLVASGPNERWWTGVRRELGMLFVLRHTAVPSTVPGDRLARATHALEQGQIDAAAAEVARLPGARRAGDWLALARRYVLARNALDRLETDALLAPPARPAPLAG